MPNDAAPPTTVTRRAQMKHPADFQPTSDPPVLKIQDWLLACESFHDGSTAVDNVTHTSQQKCFLAWNHLGLYGQKRIAHDPLAKTRAGDNWEAYKKCLIDLLGVPVHNTVAWKHLLDSQQAPGETVQEYIDHLRVSSSSWIYRFQIISDRKLSWV